MSFNHYAKMKDILQHQEPGWYIRRIDEPTSAKTFNGDVRHYDHYYRIYNSHDQPIKYCKFQQLDRLANILELPTQDLPLL